MTVTMEKLQETAESLKEKGYKVSVFETKEEGATYLTHQIQGTSVGIGGSITLEDMNLYNQLSEQNQVYWHWHVSEGETVDSMREKAAHAEVYLTSVNGMSEDGIMVNIDGYGNRLASTLYGHAKVFFVAGRNKIAPTPEDAIKRARNVAAPKNAHRLNCKTPCGEKGERCFDCNSQGRICNAMVIHYGKMSSCDMEVILINEDLGY